MSGRQVVDFRLLVDEILQAVLPEELLEGSPTGFAITGHLGLLTNYASPIITLTCIPAHMNLNAEYLPYKHIIGQVVLDVMHTIHHDRRPIVLMRSSLSTSRKTKGFEPWSTS